MVKMGLNILLAVSVVAVAFTTTQVNGVGHKMGRGVHMGQEINPHKNIEMSSGHLTTGPGPHLGGIKDNKNVETSKGQSKGLLGRISGDNKHDEISSGHLTTGSGPHLGEIKDNIHVETNKGQSKGLLDNKQLEMSSGHLTTGPGPLLGEIKANKHVEISKGQSKGLLGRFPGDHKHLEKGDGQGPLGRESGAEPEIKDNKHVEISEGKSKGLLGRFSGDNKHLEKGQGQSKGLLGRFPGDHNHLYKGDSQGPLGRESSTEPEIKDNKHIETSEGPGKGGVVGGKQDVDDLKTNDHVDDLKTNDQIQQLGRYCVLEYNKGLKLKENPQNADKLLSFSEVIKAEVQVVAGLKYFLRISVATTKGQAKIYDAMVYEKPGSQGKEMLLFAPTKLA